MYTVKREKAFTKLEKNGSIRTDYLMHLTVDTVSDIPEAKESWLAGSRCDVLEDNGHVYELSNSREWVEVNFFEQVGDGDGTDLSDYYTKSQTDLLLEGKLDKIAGMGLSENNFTDAEKTKLAGLENYDDANLKAEINFAVNSGTKNYLKLDSGLPESVNGLTVTCQADGGICFNGTAEADIACSIFNGSKNPDWAEQHLHQKLILSGCPAGGSASTYRMQFWRYKLDTSAVYDEGNGVTLTFENPGTVTENNNTWRVVILISAGQVCENLTFYPMIRDAGITDNSYQPYAMTNAELTTAVLTLLQNTGISAVSAETIEEKE